MTHTSSRARVALEAAWPAAAMAIAFYVGARLGTRLVFPGTNIGLFWPPAGVALAMTLRFGTRTWPGIAAGALAALLPDLLARHPAPVALAIGAGEAFADVVPVLLAVRWIRRALRGADPLAQVADAMRLLFWGGPVAQALAASLGVAVLAAGGSLSLHAAAGAWAQWWSSNVVSVLVLTPLCLAWCRTRTLRQPLQHVLFYAGTVALGLLLSAGIEPAVQAEITYPAFLIVIGAAFLLGVRGATMTTFLLGACALWATASGIGRIDPGLLGRKLVLFDFYLATLALGGTAFAILLEERRRSAARAADGEALLRALVDASPLPMSWAHGGERIEFWSRRAEELFGYTLSDVPTVTAWFERAYPDPAYRADVAERWARATREARARGGTIVVPALSVRCKDGSDRTVDLFGAFTRGRTLVVFTDLTDRLRAEAQRDELRHQLAQAQRLDSIGRLAGGVAHDLNNLLVPILGYADLLRGEAAPGSSAAQDLLELRQAAERARDLTRQLLAFGRRQVLDLRPLDLGAALRHIERLLRRTLREDIRVEVQLPPRGAPVRGDAGQIDQVLMNLAVNAQQAMPGGGVLTLAVTEVVVVPGDAAAARGVAPGAWVQLTVADTGVGMDAARLERIFEPFFTTRSASEGTGLGLSIVHGIVTQHGGHVFAESEPGRGTTFRVLLPRVEGEAVPVQAREARTHPAGTREGLLLAEDDPSVRTVTRRMLEGLGYRVVAAGGPEECLRVAESGAPVDLLVTDVVMPGLDGRALHDRICALRPGLPVVYMSGYAGDVLDGRGLQPGSVLLPKPFVAEALGAAIRRALGEPPTEEP